MNYLTEGTFSSALGAINDFKNFVFSIKDVFKKPNTYNDEPYLNGSIAEYSKDLIMSFPMLCDNTLPPETASMISRANERYLITLLQLLFASQQISGNGGVDVIRRIHKNIRSNLALDDYIDIVDNLSSTAKDYKYNESYITREANRCERIMTESLKRTQNKSYPVSSFSERSLNEYSILSIAGRSVIKEENYGPWDFYTYSQYYGDDQKGYDNYLKYYKTLSDDQRRYIDSQYKSMQLQMNADKNANDEYYRNLQKKEREQDLEYQKSRDKDLADFRNKQLSQGQDRFEFDKKKFGKQFGFDKSKFNQQFGLDKQRYANDLIRMQQAQDQQSAEFFTRQLLDSDVKKCNEMAPSLIIIKYLTTSQYSANDGTMIRSEKPFIAGVKSRLIPVDSMDIVERLATKNKTKISFLNFIRATTGEIRFMRDFLLSLDQAKIDAKNAIKKGPSASMWKTLEYRASKNQRRKIAKSGNDASAITTLVINQETVNFLRKQYEFDLERIQNTRMIMDAYNLLGIIICDESIQVAKIYYAGNDNYEQQAYSYLEKESSDKSYKKVVSLIGQINGR